jgi:hypothetical protein
VVVLLVTGTLGRILGPLLGYAKTLVLGLFGLPDFGMF